MEPPFFCESEQIRRETAWKTTCVWVWVLVEKCQVEHQNFPRKNEPHKFHRVFTVLLYAKSTKNIKRWRNLFIKNLLRRNQIVHTDNEKNKNRLLFDKVSLYQKSVRQNLWATASPEGQGLVQTQRKSKASKKFMGQERIFLRKRATPGLAFSLRLYPSWVEQARKRALLGNQKNTMGSDVP